MPELFGTAGCPCTADLRGDLAYDVEADPAALARIRALTNGGTTVPVLVEDGVGVQVGWQGRGCFVGGSSSSSPSDA